jgi:hypothetical protein
MKRKTVWILLAVLGLWAVGYSGSAAQAQTPRPPVGSVPHVRLMAEDLRVNELTISPDPVRTGQEARFAVTVHNRSAWAGKIRLAVRDRDETVVEAPDLLIRPGANRLELPRTGYRFDREDHCFTVLVDIEGTWRPVDLAKQFCAGRTEGGWTLSAAASPPSAPRLQPEDLRVNELTISPDPVRTGEEARFGVTVHNRSSWTGRVRLLVRDRDEVAAEAPDVLIRPGANRLELPRTGYRFNREDHCFTVLVDIEGTWRPLDLARRFCAERTQGGWTLSAAVPPPAPQLQPEDLRVNELTISPDPVRTGQQAVFGVTVYNRSSWTGKVRLLVRDRDEVAVEAPDVLIRPGANRLELPRTGYRFSREDHCFTVLVDIEGTWRPLDLAKRFCAERTQGGWTLSATAPPPPAPRLQPEDLRVNEMTMNPSPVRTGQQVRFGITVHNRSAWAGRIRLVIRDRDEVVVEANDVQVRPGPNRVEFPRTGYRFSRNDHCFTVLVDIEGTWRPVDLAKKFCAGRTAGGWTLQP